MTMYASLPERSDARRVVIDVESACSVLGGDTQRTAMVVASPHSGDRYPIDLLAASKLDAAALRRSEDAHVDVLFGGAVDIGAPLLHAHFPRAYVDVNREAYELDPLMFDAPLPPYAKTRSPRVAAGLGSIPRVVAAGVEIYDRRLSFAEAAARLEHCYRPYHTALRRLVKGTRSTFGVCLLVDAHSMPSAGLSCRDDPSFGQIDFVLGDNHGHAADRIYLDAAKTWLEGRGYAVAVNDPYPGGFVTKTYGAPSDGVHALQIEVNRALYMDEMTYARVPYFETLRQDMTDLLGHLAKSIPANAA
jgi:N-formylglutamate amidohydrolase